ncbi:molybdopterin-binding protein [Haloarcula litorea]|uniref:molybdopterin-binding protein n=1 Tax=Haloarcula litorea TaxID=3032579 RepID=UPI0023E8D8A6|nr:molybdopterin-binding protein [Halomicroarcula sp. GDY20]
MVDFQSRDTRRGVDDDQPEGEDESEDETDADEQAAEPADARQPADGADTREAEVDGDDEGAAAASDADGEPTDDAPAAETADDPLAEPGSEQGTDGPGDDSPADGPPAAGAAGSKVAGGRPEATASPDDDAAPAIDVALVGVGTEDGGALETAAAAVESCGHAVATRERLRPDYDGVQQSVDALVGRDDVDAVVTVGGVGITPGQVTVEATHPLFSKALPGFGEAFRSLLFEHIGTGIVAERSTAGIADGTVVFCLPDDPEAARLGIEEIVATEGPRLVDHLSE